MGGVAAFIAILFGITQLPTLQDNSEAHNLIIYYLVSTIIGSAIFACIIHFIYIRWHTNTAWTLGGLFRSYDSSISNLQQVLELSIISTADKFEGERSVVSEVVNAVILLKRANELYQIKHHEKISKLFAMPKIRQDYHRERAEYLKSVATTIYGNYLDLKREKIPIVMQRVFCNVFYDNEEYIKL